MMLHTSSGRMYFGSNENRRFADGGPPRSDDDVTPPGTRPSIAEQEAEAKAQHAVPKPELPAASGGTREGNNETATTKMKADKPRRQCTIS
jgi:hypothetical protein